jgi:hypothetical protein
MLSRKSASGSSEPSSPFDGGDDFVGIGGPDEGLGSSLVSRRKRLIGAWSSTIESNARRLKASWSAKLRLRRLPELPKMAQLSHIPHQI